MVNLDSNTKLYIRELSGSKGVLLVDKPISWTSFDVVAYIRSITKVKKIGHTGTLDPFASGLLIVLVGSDNTKQQAKYLKLDKRYQFKIQLGFCSDTLDPTGTITIGRDNGEIGEDYIRSVVSKLVGKQEQVPPAFSAKKINGQRSYKLIRSGKIPVLQPQNIEIFKLELLDFDRENRTITISAKVSSGTYIRTLAAEIAKRLESDGYCLELRRTAIGEFVLSDN